MASSYSTDLKLELMVTGENSGTWGDKTNSNLNLLQQAIAGFQSVALTSTNTVAFAANVPVNFITAFLASETVAFVIANVVLVDVSAID